MNSDSNNETVGRLLTRWKAEGQQPHPAVGAAAIAEFEALNGIVFPPDVRAYLLATDGQPNSKDTFSFWPLKVWVPVEIGAPRWQPRLRLREWFLFADYLVWSCGYAVSLSPTSPEYGSVVVLEGPEPEKAATSFRNFLERYLDDFEGLITLM